MNGKGSQPSLFTSLDPSIPIRGEDYLPPDYREGICWVTGCTNRRDTNIGLHQFPKKTLPAIFGLLPDNDPAFKEWETYFDWQHYPDDAWVCMKHYGKLRNKHGIDLAYRYRNGKLEGYIKDYWF